jgi:hypothetical protein
LSLASPIFAGELWRIRGRVGKSARTYRRSIIAPAIEVHPEEAGRLEYKTFEMTTEVSDFHAYFLLWLAILLDAGLRGRASSQSRIYDLGAVAVDGLAAETTAERAAEVLGRAPTVLTGWGFDPAPLSRFKERLDRRRVPADDIVALFQTGHSIPLILRSRSELLPEARSVLSPSGTQ